jgi:hypothetical protein
MTATVRSAQIPKVGGELRLVDLPPVQVGRRIPASGGHLMGVSGDDTGPLLRNSGPGTRPCRKDPYAIERRSG